MLAFYSAYSCNRNRNMRVYWKVFNKPVTKPDAKKMYLK